MTSTSVPTPEQTLIIVAYGRKVRGRNWEIVYIERER